MILFFRKLSVDFLIPITGFIITHVNSKKVTSVEELEDIIKDIEGGVMLEGIYEDMPGVYYYAFGL